MLASAVIWIVLSLTVLGAVLPRRRRNITELTIGTTALIVVSIFLVPLIGSTLHPVYTADSGSNAGLTQRIFVAAWWLLAARIVVLAGRIAIGIRHREHAVRLASDLAAGAVYLGAILTVLSLSFSVSVAGLVATSGIIAIVVGLALQSTLGDLFSGIALGIEKPFGIGDYIWLEGAIEGLVLETNWRATRIVTDSNDIATVPNSVIAKGRLLNRSRPNETRTDTVRIVLEPSVSPSRGTQLLTAAALSTSGLARDPPTHVICTELRGEGTAYEIRFSAPRRALLEARSLLLHSVARHARHAGIAMALQNGLPLQGMPASERDRLLSESELLRDLGPEDLAQLAAQLVERRGRANETLFKQGGHKASLFFIAEGAFEVLHEDGANGKRLVH